MPLENILQEMQRHYPEDVAQHISQEVSRLDLEHQKALLVIFREQSVINALAESSPWPAREIVSSAASIVQWGMRESGWRSLLQSMRTFLPEWIDGYRKKKLEQSVAEARRYVLGVNGVRESLNTSESLFDEVMGPVWRDLDFGSAEVVKAFLYDGVMRGKSETQLVLYAQEYLIPSIKIICGLHKDKHHPWTGVEFGVCAGQKTADGHQARLLLQRMETVKKSHCVTRSSFDGDVFEVRTLPSYYPVLKVEVDYLMKVGLLPEGLHMYHTCISGRMNVDDVLFALMVSLFADCPSMISKSLISRAKNKEGMGFPGAYVGISIDKTGLITAEQTNLFDGMLFYARDTKSGVFKKLRAMPEDVVGNYAQKFVRYGLIGAAVFSGDTLVRKAYDDFKEAFREHLVTHGLCKHEAAFVLGECYDKVYVDQTHPVNNSYIRTAVKYLLKAGKQDNFVSLREMISKQVCGWYDINGMPFDGLLQCAYNEVERMCVGTFMQRRFKHVIEGLEQASNNCDYRDAAKKLLAYAKK